MSTNEQDFHDSGRDAWIAMLRLALERLGADDPAASEARWALERAETVAALRRVCGNFGDNTWKDGHHLGEVIERHLRRHLLELTES